MNFGYFILGGLFGIAAGVALTCYFVVKPLTREICRLLNVQIDLQITAQFWRDISARLSENGTRLGAMIKDLQSRLKEETDDADWWKQQ